MCLNLIIAKSYIIGFVIHFFAILLLFKQFVGCAVHTGFLQVGTAHPTEF